MLHYVDILLPYEDLFNKVKSSHVKRVYYNICDGYGVNANEMWMNGGWLNISAYSSFGDGEKTTSNVSTTTLHDR